MMLSTEVALKRTLIFFVLLLCTMIIVKSLWFFALEYGKKLDNKIYICHRGVPMKNGLVYVGIRKMRWHWYYQEAIAGSKLADELEEKTMGVGKYVLTGDHGEIFLRGRSVELSIVISDGPLEYLFSRKLTPFSMIPEKIDVKECADLSVTPIYYDPETFFPTDRENLLIHKRIMQDVTNNAIDVYANEPDDKENKNLLSQNFKELGERCDVLFLRIVSDNGDWTLTENLPYEVRFHDSQLSFVKYITPSIFPTTKKSTSIQIFVPKNHTYDIIFHPGKTEWPGSEYSNLLPKPLEPLTIRNIRPRHLPTEPFETIVLKRSKDYTPDWKERSLAQRKQAKDKASRLSHLVEKFRQLTNLGKEHRALLLLLLVPFIVPLFIRRILSKRGQRGGDEE